MVFSICLIDNTYENKLTVNKINNDVSDFKCNQSIITYKNKEFQIKNYIEYTGYDDKIIENIYLYDNIVSNEYLFKNNSNQTCNNNDLPLKRISMHTQD